MAQHELVTGTLRNGVYQNLGTVVRCETCGWSRRYPPDEHPTAEYQTHPDLSEGHTS